MNNYPFTKNELKSAVAAVRDADLAALPEETSGIDFGQRSEARMRTAVRKAKGRRSFRKTVFGIAAALGIAVFGGATFLTVDAEARDAFKSWVREIYENQIVYRFSESGDSSILDRVSVGWVPEGYDLVAEDAIEGVSKTFVYSKAESELWLIIYFDAYNDDLVSALSSTNNTKLTSFEIDEMVADYYNDEVGNSDSLTVFNDKHKLMIGINGYLTLDEMKKIINSIIYY